MAKGIYGNPWVYLEASFQVDRTFTSIARAFRNRYPQSPCLGQLAAWFPVALMGAVRRITGFHLGPVEIDFQELAERHFTGAPNPVGLAQEVISFWKTKDGDELATGFRLDFNPDTGIAVIDWPAFRERYAADAAFSVKQKERVGKRWEKSKPVPPPEPEATKEEREALLKIMDKTIETLNKTGRIPPCD